MRQSNTNGKKEFTRPRSITTDCYSRELDWEVVEPEEGGLEALRISKHQTDADSLKNEDNHPSDPLVYDPQTVHSATLNGNSLFTSNTWSLIFGTSVGEQMKNLGRYPSRAMIQELVNLSITKETYKNNYSAIRESLISNLNKLSRYTDTSSQAGEKTRVVELFEADKLVDSCLSKGLALEDFSKLKGTLVSRLDIAFSNKRKEEDRALKSTVDQNMMSVLDHFRYTLGTLQFERESLIQEKSQYKTQAKNLKVELEEKNIKIENGSQNNTKLQKENERLTSLLDQMKTMYEDELCKRQNLEARNSEPGISSDLQAKTLEVEKLLEEKQDLIREKEDLLRKIHTEKAEKQTTKSQLMDSINFATQLEKHLKVSLLENKKLKKGLSDKNDLQDEQADIKSPLRAHFKNVQLSDEEISSSSPVDFRKKNSPNDLPDEVRKCEDMPKKADGAKKDYNYLWNQHMKIKKLMTQKLKLVPTKPP